MDVPSLLWLLPSHTLSRQCFVGAASGVLLHISYFIRGYHDTSAFGIFAAHVAAFLVVTTALVVNTGFYIGLLGSFVISTSYLVALFTSIAVYRVFFHPLSHFPGPLAAKLTKFYGPYTARNGQMHIEQNKLFKKYGDIVRTGPNELFILSSDAIQKIHAAKSGCSKQHAGFYPLVEYKGQHNLDSIQDREEHRWRRQVWERAMTSKPLLHYEKTTREVSKTWLNKLATLTGTPIDSSLFSLLIAFNHMGKIGFSHDFGAIEAGKEVHMLHLLEVTFGQIGQLGELIWPLSFLKSLGIGGEAAEFDELACRMADWRQEAHDEKGLTDIFGHLLEDHISEKPTAFANRNTLYSDSSLLLIAATDTIAVALSYAFYNLAVHQQYQKELHDAVAKVFGRTLPGEFTNEDLSKIEFLDAVINETLRLDNPACNDASRLSPPGGIVVGETWIPGGCGIRVPGYAMQRSGKAFVHPDDFIPERFTTKPELILDQAAFFPFLVGPTNCVGKRFAMMVLRLVLSYTVYHYQFQLAPGEDGVAIYSQARNNIILKAGPLKLVFTKQA